MGEKIINANIGGNKLSSNDNCALILDTVRRVGPIGRADIAKFTNLSGPTVTPLVRDLIKAGFLKEDEFGASKGGRPPILLRLVPDALFAIGVDIGAAKLRAAVVDLEANIVTKVVKKTNANEGKKATLERTMNTILEIVEKSKVEINKIKGIGIGISGIVDHDKGVCLFWPNVEGWQNVPLKKIIEQEFGIETVIDDSARTMTLAESWCGLAKNVENFIFVNVGIGVGSGVFIHGELYRGSGGTAGELGHTTVEENGPRCNCGNFGCLETLVSGPAIARRAREALEQGVISLIEELAEGDLDKVTPEVVVAAAKRDDKLAFNIMEKTGEYLGIGIANAINLFNPDLVIIGAGVSKAGRLLLDPVKRVVKARALQVASDKVDVKLSTLGDDAGLLGAAILILKNIFAPRVSYVARKSMQF